VLHQLRERKYTSAAWTRTWPSRSGDRLADPADERRRALLGTEPSGPTSCAGWSHAATGAGRGNLLTGKTAGNLPDHRMVERMASRGPTPTRVLPRDSPRPRKQFTGGSRPRAPARAGGRPVDRVRRLATFTARTSTHRDGGSFAAGEAEMMAVGCLRSRSAAQLFAYRAEQVRYESKIFRVAEEVAKAAGLKLPSPPMPISARACGPSWTPAGTPRRTMRSSSRGRGAGQGWPTARARDVRHPDRLPARGHGDAAGLRRRMPRTTPPAVQKSGVGGST
jgi:hypothetical protein